MVGYLTGYSIPQGWCVLASFSSVHMNENNYENPYQFDPWRWEVMHYLIWYSHLNKEKSCLSG